MVSKENAERFTWQEVCEGWHLARSEDLSVAQERMPPGTAEVRHYHSRVRQFFYVLSGALTLEVGGASEDLQAGEGLEVAPRVPHQARNDSGAPCEFLVVSSGLSREDRHPA